MRGERRAHPLGLDLALLHLLGEQLAGLVQAEVERFRADVLHDDRRALDGALVGDAAAHDAGAEHGGLR